MLKKLTPNRHVAVILRIKNAVTICKQYNIVMTTLEQSQFEALPEQDFQDTSQLTEEECVVFMEVIEEALNMASRTQLFNWLQKGVQYLIGHEVMLFGVRGQENVLYDYEYLTTSRYFTETQFDAVIKQDSGIVKAAIAQWIKMGVPVFVSNELPSSEHDHYIVQHESDEAIRASELKTFVVHGFGDARTRNATIVVFGRLTSPINARTARMIKLLMPHLHCALIKVTSSRMGMVNYYSPTIAKHITKREAEILHWLQMGKTNWEISSILQVSHLTVKNHVHNIIRKLGVENRRQAAIKAAKIGISASDK